VYERARTRQDGEEKQRTFQRRDAQQIETGVVGGDLRAQFADPCLNLLGGEVGLADAQFVG